jgi:hypothetical protein
MFLILKKIGGKLPNYQSKRQIGEVKIAQTLVPKLHNYKFPRLKL